MMSYDAGYVLKAASNSAISGFNLVFVFGCGGFLVGLGSGTGKLEAQPRTPKAAGAGVGGSGGRSGGLWEVQKASNPCKIAL